MGHPQLTPYEVTWEDLLLGGGLGASFPDPTLPLEVEIGPGDDDFLLKSAAAHPDVNWLGIEYSHKRVRRYVRRVERATVAGGGDFPNLRLIWRPAADLVRPFLSPGKVATYHIHFPDPWPKAHHARFRLLQTAFLADLAESLEPGGLLRIATDAHEYALDTLDAAHDVPALHNLIGGLGYQTEPPTESATVFEERWRTEGRSIYALLFERLNSAEPVDGGASSVET